MLINWNNELCFADGCSHWRMKCGWRFFFSVSFVRRHLSIGHIDTHRNQSFECDKCPKASVSRHYLKLHIKNVHTAPRDLLCPHCGHAYRTLCTLNNHRRFKYKGGGIQCNICGKKFKDNCGLKRHMPVHEEKSETFPVCKIKCRNMTSHSCICLKEKPQKKHTCHHW